MPVPRNLLDQIALMLPNVDGLFFFFAVAQAVVAVVFLWAENETTEQQTPTSTPPTLRSTITSD